MTQPASRCKTCADEATPPPAGWRDRIKESK